MDLPNTDNVAKFSIEYEKQLYLAVQKYPTEYTYVAKDVPGVAARMVNATVRGSANIHSPAFRWTCKALGIKYTQRDIHAFLYAK